MKNENNETMDPIEDVVSAKTQARIILAQARQAIHAAIDNQTGTRRETEQTKRQLHAALSKIDTAEKLIEHKLRSK